MALIKFSIDDHFPGGSKPATGHVVFEPSHTHIHAGDTLATVRPFTVNYHDDFTVDLEVTQPNWAWKITVNGVRGEISSGYYNVSVDNDFVKLTSVDPDTLEPNAEPEPAWWAMARATVVGGSVDANGDLILTRNDGGVVNAGRVRGKDGTPGDPGEDGSPGSPGSPGAPGTPGVDGKDSGGYLLVSRPTGGDDGPMLNDWFGSGNKSLCLHAGAVYKIRTPIASYVNGLTVDFNGATLDFTEMSPGVVLGERVGIKFAGSRVATLNITNPLVSGATVITGISNTATISAGDLVLLRNEEQPLPGMTRGDRDKGELVRVKTVDSTTQITIRKPLRFSYGVTGLLINTLNLVKDITLINPKIKMGGVGSNHNGIEVQYGDNIRVNHSLIDGAEGIGINFRTVIDGVINHPTVKNSTSGTAGTTGYGIAFNDASTDCSVNFPKFENCRHFIAGGGVWPSTNIKVNDASGSISISSAYDCHESTYDWEFNNCTASNVHGGFIIRGQNIRVNNGKIRNSTNWGYQAMVFDGVSEQRGIKFNNCEVDGAVLGGFQIDGIADNSRKIDCSISNGVANNPGNYGVSASNFENLHIDVKVSGSKDHSILAQGVSTANRSKDLTLGARVDKSLKNSLFLRHIDGIVGLPSNLTNSGANGVQLTECSALTLSAMRIAVTALGGIIMDGCVGVELSSPRVSGGVSASYDAVRATNTTDLTIVGGKLSSPRNAIYTTTTDYVVVQGTNVRGAGSANKINIDATNKLISTL